MMRLWRGIASSAMVCGLAVALCQLECGGSTSTVDMVTKTMDMGAPNMDMMNMPSPDMLKAGCPSCAAPVLSSVNPRNGPIAGGTPLVIDGQNFVAGTNVTIAGAAATQVSVTSSTRITATLPASHGFVGPVSVVVTNPDGQLASRSDLFSYYANPPFINRTFIPGSFGMGTGVTALLAGDFNGDNLPDVVVSVGSTGPGVPGTVNLLLNDGTGGLGAPSSFAVGSLPQSIAGGDFNGDNKLDVAVANYYSQSISVLLGNGKGSFAPAINIPVGTDSSSAPAAIVSGDFNGDGKLDLVVSNPGDGNLNVLLGDGKGGFGATNIPGVATYALTVADFNGDHHADLAFTSNATTSTDVNVMLGDGLGGFGPVLTSYANMQPLQLAVGDFNEDGKPDIAVANTFPGGAFALRGNGMGGFGFPQPVFLGPQPWAVAVADFNLDTHADVVFVQTNGNVDMLMGIGDGSFGITSTYSVVAGYAPAVAVADFNGDHKPDLAVLSSNQITLMLNQAQ